MFTLHQLACHGAQHQYRPSSGEEALKKNALARWVADWKMARKIGKARCQNARRCFDIGVTAERLACSGPLYMCATLICKG